MGSNMAECHPVGFQWVMEAKLRGTQVIHIDPRFTRTSANATRHLSIRAGRPGGPTHWFFRHPVALLFLGLALVYISELFASLRSSLAERALGAARILTGLWLIYLTWAVALNLSSGFKLWV